jgi:hypothetical protein
MPALFRRPWALAVLAGLLLVSTSGITVSRMTCLLSGRSVLSLGRAADCCPPDEHDGPALQAACCAVVQAGAERADLVHAAAPLCVALPLADAAPRWSPRETAVPAVPVRDSRPPPLAGRARLVRESRFLI